MANAFAASGWRVTVLTARREVFERYTGVDPTLEARIDPRVRVERIDFEWEALDTDVSNYSWLRAHFPVTWRRVRARTDKIRFPESGYGPWRPVLAAAVARLHAADPVDLVVATANPHVAFTGAWELHRRHGVPFVMDYRDAWLLDVFSGRRLHGPHSRAARWEAKLVAAATEVWFVNEPIAAWHRALYPAAADRMHVVANGYDVDGDLPVGDLPVADLAVPEPVACERALRFGYIGTVTPKVPVAEFLAGWRSARGSCADLTDAEVRLHGYLGYYRAPRAELVSLIDAAAEAGVTYEGPVGKGDVLQVYRGLDALLLLLGTGLYVTSGKVFEYMSTGLPIVSVHHPDNAASDVLRGYPSWFPVEGLRPEQIAEALAAAAAAARVGDPARRAAGVAFAEQFRRDRQLQPRLDALRGAVGRKA
jgi:glycosyltransferase involved in cell wall biosynthesis